MSEAAEIFGPTFASIFSAVSGPSTRIHKRTASLRDAILEVTETAEPPFTVRQIFYMVASVGKVSKDIAGYRKVQRQVLAMRRERMIDYSDIADNTRWRIKPDTSRGLSAFLQRSARFYRQDLWVRSPYYLEIWCEKDSIAGVIHPVTDEYDVPLYVARGYSSETFAHSAAIHMEAAAADGKSCVVYYVGDFDPSGWDASRDLERRLTGFFPDVEFTRLGINRRDITNYNLLTRPTKASDTRARRFFAEFGRGQESCELEAMHPDDLRRLIRQAIEGHVNREELDRLQLEERLARETLQQFAARAAGGAS